MIRIFIERSVTPDELIQPGIVTYKLRKAYLEYEEEGEEPSIYIREEISAETARKLLSKKMIEILKTLSSEREYNISKLSELLHRSPSNVHRDLAFLKKHKLLTFIDRGREKIPILLLKRVVVEVRDGS
ncbi:HVO_A0114 family putative DNA-binding protein [Infirmifilum sp. SLHALR2]|nr:MAG: hypothetical protein B7L53_09050 [Thermofilum sp. NZ13]